MGQPNCLSFGRMFALVMLMTVAACADSDARGAEAAARAQQLLDQKRIVEARMAINEAIATRDDEFQYHILRGRIEFAANAIPNAFDAYNDARSLDPSNVEALHAVSQLGLQTGQLRESLEATDALLAITPDDPVALLTRGLHSIIRSRFDEADTYADRILAKKPGDEGGAVLKARVAFSNGKPEAALEILDRYSASGPPTAAIALTRLEIFRELRDALRLDEQFALLRGLQPESAVLRIDEANFAFKQGRIRDGLNLTAVALAEPKLSVELIDTIIAIWREYSVTDLPASAVAAIADRGSLPARSAVAAFLAGMGHPADVSRLIERLPDTDKAAIQALAAQTRGDVTTAYQKANAALEDDSTHCLALTVRAQSLLRSAKPGSALRSAQRAASQCPKASQAWSLAADAYAMQGDDENARRMWRQGVKSSPQNSVIASDYTKWLLRKGNAREAVAVARRLSHNAPALLSGWSLYLDTCRKTKSDCVALAQRGLEDAKTRYGVDMVPGEAPPNSLFGRIAAR